MTILEIYIDDNFHHHHYHPHHYRHYHHHHHYHHQTANFPHLEVSKRVYQSMCCYCYIYNNNIRIVNIVSQFLHLRVQVPWQVVWQLTILNRFLQWYEHHAVQKATTEPIIATKTTISQQQPRLIVMCHQQSTTAEVDTMSNKVQLTLQTCLQMEVVCNTRFTWAVYWMLLCWAPPSKL